MIEVFGAREHNLKNIDVRIPRNQLVVITGLSGSGKSSLAFDTIYAEGQRRYIESFPYYARQFLGSPERPDVDQITGLSPVISIEQKTTNKNPRSTVGTTTEIYDFMRLLFARVSDAFSYVTGEKMIRYTDEQIINLIVKKYLGKQIIILAPVVKGRKGHYRKLFQQILKQGFLRARIDGEIIELTHRLQIDRYKTHDIEIVIDTLSANKRSLKRMSESVQTAMKHGKGTIIVIEDGRRKMDDGKKTSNITYFSRHLMCPTSGISYPEPEPNTFSFNSPYGACPNCNGIGLVSEIDVDKIIPNRQLSIENGGITPIGKYKNSWIFKQLEAIGEKYNFTLSTTIKKISEDAINTILYGSDEMLKIKNMSYENGGAQHVSTDYTLSFEGIVNFLFRQYQDAPSPSLRKWVQGFMNKNQCPECDGTRLKKESLYFKIAGKNIAELANMDIRQLFNWFKNIETRLDKRQTKIAGEILKELRTRIQFLLDVGLEYLTLNRVSRTLSGGESQRIRLATQIGSQLVGVLYILDEPSIGLHQRDNSRLIQALKKLIATGNSVIVVEHDKQMIQSADHIIDMGPGAGIQGGEIVAEGQLMQLNFNSQSLNFTQGKHTASSQQSVDGSRQTRVRSTQHQPSTINHQPSSTLTSQYLSGEKKIAIPTKRRKGIGKILTLKGAKGNNLKNISVKFPLGKLICITGVSGSGKSTLVNETLYPILNRQLYKAIKNPLSYSSIDGLQHIDKVIEIDQSPIGRTPRSNPATYTGAFTEIRHLFIQLPESKIRGYKPGRFSFNVKGGRCETCRGAGMRTIEMNFLPDVYVNCETCNGKRYNRETLEIRYKGKSISDVLNMTINQAVDFFEKIPAIIQKIRTLRDVGLGYITLGQPSTTLSGGEAQRVKLAAELSKRNTGKTFYILDEPTTGLHFEDVRVLLEVLNWLVDKGNTVVIIEHNMDIIKVADHIIDLGLEGGERGGFVVCEGTPEEIIVHKNSYTALFLKKELSDCAVKK
ncbi:excinuclease ABC subunit UvrA [bacterium AH-315-M05]|nr:excinuclease ABC subunit UvrA [bacterium AH-315-M05]